MRASRRLERPKTLREAVDQALPQRRLRVAREPLIDAIVGRIETWKSLEPQVKPYAEKRSTVAAIADELFKALDKAAYKLERLGVVNEINQAMDIDPRAALGGRSPAMDLSLIVWQASVGVKAWGRVHRPSASRPRASSVALVFQLQYLCCECAGFSGKEFEGFLSGISETNGLPKLTTAALKKREERSKKKAATK